MNKPNIQALIAEVKSMAQRAGREILSIAKNPPSVETKSDGSPVTLADKASHAIIQESLSRLTPQIPVISEEEDIHASDSSRSMEESFLRGFFWLVDPLDGTKEFIRGQPDYTVNIALVENQVPILGVIYVPSLDTLYYGLSAQGAFKQTADLPAKRIHALSGDRPLIGVASRSHSNQETESFLRALQVHDTLSRGSSVKMCAVAEGSADVYPRLGPTYLWDTAAGFAICREAGCRVIDLRGNDLRYDPHGDLKHSGFVVFPQDNLELQQKVHSALGI